jgi:pyridoxine 5-phosphate synthase
MALDRDLEVLRQAIATKLNVEMAVTSEMERVALTVRPDQVTLVPERPQELTTEGGLDVVQHVDAARAFTTTMQAAGIVVSIFLDPDAAQIRKAKQVGADAIEINTGKYAEARGGDATRELDRIHAAARLGKEQGLEVLAGHGLNYTNVIPIAGIPEIVELNIGHSIVARAALVGMERAVRDMVALLGR